MSVERAEDVRGTRLARTKADQLPEWVGDPHQSFPPLGSGVGLITSAHTLAVHSRALPENPGERVFKGTWIGFDCGDEMAINEHTSKDAGGPAGYMYGS